MDNENTQIQYLKIINMIADLYKEDVTIHNRVIGFFKRLKSIVYFDKAIVIFFYADDSNHYHKHSEISLNWNKDDEYYLLDDGPLPIFDQIEPIVFHSSSFYNNEFRAKSKYWNSYLIPNNNMYSIEGNLQIDDEHGLKAGFSLYRGREKHDFTDSEVEVMKFLQPHLSNVLKNYDNTTGALNILSMFQNFSSLGLAVIDSDYEIITSGEVFKELAFDKYKSIGIINGVREQCIKMSKNDFDSIEYKFSDAPLFLEIAKVPSGTYPQIRGEAYTCLLYDMSYFSSFTLDQTKEKYGLTAREFEILQSVLKGKSNEEIAEELYLSLPTVKKYLASIYGKLGVEKQKQIFDRLKLI